MASTEKNRRRFLLTLVSAVVPALVISGSLFYLGSKIEAVDRDIDKLRSSIFEEVETHNSALQSLYSSSTLMAEDMQKLQRTLNISPGNYGLEEDIFNQEKETSSENSGEEASQEGELTEQEDAPFFKALDRLVNEEEVKKVQRTVVELFRDTETVVSLLRERGLEFRKRDTLSWELVPTDREENTDSSFRLNAQRDSAEEYTLTLYSPLVDERLRITLSGDSYAVSENEPEELVSFLSDTQEKVREHRLHIERRTGKVEELLASPRVSNLISKKKLSIGEAVHTDSKVEWTASNPRFEDSVSFGIETEEGDFFINAGEHTSFDTADKFSTALEEAVSSVDTRTEAEIAVDSSIERIRQIAEDEAFKTYLSQKDLRLVPEPREGADHLYFDILQEQHDGGEERRFGSFAVHKKEGTIYLVDSDEVIVSSLRNIAQGEAFVASASKEDLSLPKEFSSWSGTSAENQDEKVILLCGIHENNADAIMLARLSDEHIELMSIPRDIYYEQRKLASYYRAYGPKELGRVISEITGLTIDGFISVDMYAFIEVVDILGGIEVTLEKALVDPTYKVRDDGVWKTLHYPAGTHKLNGIEALRIARSRHTTDDFDRSKRQHLILAALKKRLNSLHAGDVSKLKNIFESVFNYIHTDYSLIDGVQLFASFHDVPVKSLEGISADNVLYATYSNLHRLDKDIEEVDDDFPRGAWILLPKEDDWKVIEWYVQTTFDMTDN
ncbi:MAG: LCP family protein [Spirochaetia bacterium]